MYLNYASQNLSKFQLFLSGVFSLIFIIFPLVQCFYFSFVDIVLLFLQGTLAILFISTFFSRLHTFVTERKILKSSFYIKKVTFLPDGIDFKFFQPQYDIICDYTQIEKIELIITTDIAQTKYGPKYFVKELTVNFTILNNKKITIKHFPTNCTKVIYSLIDVGKKANNFSWSFDGAGEMADVVEKITDYSEKGLKQILAKGEEDSMKMTSIVFFALGVFFAYQFKDGFDLMHLERCVLNLMAPMFFIGLSLVFDAILLMDKIREENHKLL